MKLDALNLRLRRVQPIWKLVACLFINLLIFCGLYMQLLSPQKERLLRLTEEYNTLNEKWIKMNAARTKIERARAEHGALKEKLSALFRQLPEKKEIPSLLRGIAHLARESQLKVKYFEPKGLVSKEFYAELPFELRYAGSYHSIGYFFDGMRRMERIVKIDDFTLEAKGNFPTIYVEGICNAKAFVYLREETKAKKEGKGEGKK
jgi:type IV pilus assembly protein PilO